jgi:hypothetical protein
MVITKANEFQQLEELALEVTSIDQSMDLQGLGHYLAHSPTWIERSGWILEYDLDLLPEAFQLVMPDLAEITRVVTDCAAGWLQKLY